MSLYVIIFGGEKKEHVECKRVVTLGFLSEAYENLDVGKAEFVYILSTAREYVLYMQAFVCVWWVRQHLLLLWLMEAMKWDKERQFEREQVKESMG